MARPTPSFNYYHPATCVPDEHPLHDTIVLASSRELGWDGASAQSGLSRPTEPVELAMAGHFLAMNLDSKPLPIEQHSGGHCRVLTLPPDSFQISPAHTPFTSRALKPSHYGAVEISLPKVRHLLGCDLELEAGLGVIDAPLAEVVRALLAEVARGGSSGPLYADGLLIAVVSRLAAARGRSPVASTPIGALSSKRLARVSEWIEERIDQRLTVDDLAAVAELSPAHFAREFKRATRETPHAFVVRKRLERARRMLIAGRSIAEAAHLCGFSDQAHLSRAFKEKFGVTPGAFARTSRR